MLKFRASDTELEKREHYVIKLCYGREEVVKSKEEIITRTGYNKNDTPNLNLKSNQIKAEEEVDPVAFKNPAQLEWSGRDEFMYFCKETTTQATF